LRFLIEAQHNGALGRGQVEADDIAHLLDKYWIARQLEGVAAMRLQAQI
jgi:hypothetical protein